MKYKLLKDLPFAKVGEVFERVTYKSKDGLSDYDYLKIRKREKDGEDETMFSIDYDYFLGNFDKWFEKIEEPVDSIHWKPKKGDKYFCFGNDGQIFSVFWADAACDDVRLELGNVYRTKEECKKVRERRLAEVRLRRTSTFKPDFENNRGGYVVFYDPQEGKLETHNVYCYDYGEIVRYETVEEAEKSIEENRVAWLKYFNIKEEK